jgi:hypothetical protein
MARASETVKKSQNEQKHLAQRRRGAKETKQLFFAIFASLRLCVKLSIFSQLLPPVKGHGQDAHGTPEVRMM